jgi:hypothetical protein
MVTLGLSDGGPSEGGLSGGMVIKSERIDGILPRGLLMLTLRLAVGIDGDLGKGTYAGEIYGSNVKSRRMWLIEDPPLSKSARITTAMAPLKLLPHWAGCLPSWRRKNLSKQWRVS